MDIETDAILSTRAEVDNLYQIAHVLGESLRQTLEFQNFLEMVQALNQDATIQRLLTEVRLHQSALQWGQDVTRHAAELDHLEQELEALPLFQDYRRAEAKVCALFRSVDELISQAAGVPFGANARRSCCG